MQESTIDRFVVPAPTSEDVLTQIAREGARRYLAVMIQQEVDDWLAQRAHLRDEQGRRQVVRNGYLPEREITTGVGPVKVKQPRVRDRRPEGQAEPFSSKILPPYLRKTKSIEELIPWLYLKGVSTGDFGEALKALLGPDCPGLSATTVTRLKSVWEGLLLDVKARGLVIDPKLAIGDGALGFWKALRQVYPKTRDPPATQAPQADRPTGPGLRALTCHPNEIRRKWKSDVRKVGSKKHLSPFRAPSNSRQTTWP